MTVMECIFWIIIALFGLIAIVGVASTKYDSERLKKENEELKETLRRRTTNRGGKK